LAKPTELEVAFDAALTLVQRSVASGAKTSDGSSALPQLEKLERELRAQRASALERGNVDRDWFRKTVRWVVEWVPDDELTLVAALGRIVRAAPPDQAV
jgi:hypothetical protein